MIQKSWKMIGPVTLKTYDNAVRVFDTLENAVKAVGERNIEMLKYGHLQTWDDWIYPPGDRFVFIDELGFTIPVWKVKEVYSSTKKPQKAHPKILFGFKWKWRKIVCKHTRGYHRDWVVEDWEELDSRQFHRLKNHGKPTHETAPISWDECSRWGYRDRCWKSYRRTQYKEKK